MKIPTLRARPVASLCLPAPRLALLSLLAGSACGAFAQPAPASSELLAQNLRAPSLSETVVAATRTEQPLSDLVADVSIVDRDSIERSGATGLGDLLA